MIYVAFIIINHYTHWTHLAERLMTSISTRVCYCLCRYVFSETYQCKHGGVSITNVCDMSKMATTKHCEHLLWLKCCLYIEHCLALTLLWFDMKQLVLLHLQVIAAYPIKASSEPLVRHSGFSSPRINLSPFTKDFRGEEHYNESID